MGSAVLAAGLGLAGCGAESPVLTFSGSAVGTEGEVVRRQVERFAAARPGLRVEIRPTPDAADQRHQLYVQWLNARSPEPDVLQLDVIWTAEFAAAGWILPLDRFSPTRTDYFEAGIRANTWQSRLYALPWFMDVGMLYWRQDLVSEAPATLEALTTAAAGAGTPYGIVWQGARYEGLVTVFLEFLGAHGGRILGEGGLVEVDSEAALRALTAMRDQVHRERVAPPAVLTWQEEQTRFAFQNGQAAFMRNWPYAYALLQDSAESAVAGRFGVAPMPAAAGGRATAALGGAQLAINAHSAEPELAWELIAYLLAPAQMLERARVVGQYPSRPALFDDPALAEALAVPPAEARAIIERAEPRPVTPVYTQLSEILQIQLHRALTRQAEPRAALARAAAEMRRVLAKSGLAPGADHGPAR